jgi:hypothetical protein
MRQACARNARSSFPPFAVDAGCGRATDGRERPAMAGEEQAMEMSRLVCAQSDRVQEEKSLGVPEKLGPLPPYLLRDLSSK